MTVATRDYPQPHRDNCKLGCQLPDTTMLHKVGITISRGIMNFCNINVTEINTMFLVSRRGAFCQRTCWPQDSKKHKTHDCVCHHGLTQWKWVGWKHQSRERHFHSVFPTTVRVTYSGEVFIYWWKEYGEEDIASQSCWAYMSRTRFAYFPFENSMSLHMLPKPCHMLRALAVSVSIPLDFNPAGIQHFF